MSLETKRKKWISWLPSWDRTWRTNAKRDSFRTQRRTATNYKLQRSWTAKCWDRLKWLKLHCWLWMTTSCRRRQDWRSSKTRNWRLSWSTNPSRPSNCLLKTTRCRRRSTRSTETLQSTRKLRRNWLRDRTSARKSLSSLKLRLRNFRKSKKEWPHLSSVATLVIRDQRLFVMRLQKNCRSKTNSSPASNWSTF